MTVLNPHDSERDRIARIGLALDFTCDACGLYFDIPKTAVRVQTEVSDANRLRADVVALDADGRIVGVIEVIRTNAPDKRKMEAQARFEFAYRRVLPYDVGRTYWFCSDVCRLSGELWGGVFQPEEPESCCVCDKFFFSNPISPAKFVDWEGGAFDGTGYCIECAVREFPEGGAQWRSPGELIGIDLSLVYDNGADDPVTHVHRLGDAAFWRMVWRSRRDQGSYYDGRFPEREEATRRQLARIDEALKRDDHLAATSLLAPIGAPAWSASADDGPRMMAFEEGNCVRVAEAWERIFELIVAALPPALAKARNEPSSWDRYAAVTRCADMGESDCENFIGECERWCRHDNGSEPEHRRQGHDCHACGPCAACNKGKLLPPPNPKPEDYQLTVTGVTWDTLPPLSSNSTAMAKTTSLAAPPPDGWTYCTADVDCNEFAPEEDNPLCETHVEVDGLLQ